MLIIERKQGESIDRFLRRYKRKHRDTQIIREVRRRQQYTKPSEKRRKEILKVAYNNKKQSEES